ncbi:hypothetical protein [Nocardiopsis composta]|uniref:Uncharacterized protein n=1 Tax=Nocardiopsis composta TaxID=157465 RepID=A0A7W8VDI6_9ACTN|nr:hypothetical protein [Nocardiopsis composta]MBB5432297.1 hypothetical protein [Nocardiopsis composta]
MRKHHKRWAALAGMTAASLTGFGLLGGASATADDREELPWPVIQQRVSSYSLDGFQITDLPSGLDGYAIKARSFTNGTGERQAEISWVQGPESVYGKVSVLRSEKFRSLEDLRDRNYDHLSRGSLKKVQVNGKDAYLSETSGDLFRLEEPGVAVTVYLQPDRWETKDLLGFAESVRPQRAAQGDTGAPADKPAEKPADKPAEKPAAEADKPAEKPAEKPTAEAEKPAEEPVEKPAAEADKPAEKPAEKPAAETEQGPEAGESQQQDGAPAPERPAGQQEPSAPETEVPRQQDRPGTAPAAETGGAEPVADTPAEGRPAPERPADQEGPAEDRPSGDASAEQKPAADADAAVQEGALELPEGTTPTEIRVCLLEELGGKALTEDEVAASRDAAAFTVLWEKADADAQWEALETCIDRLQSSGEQVDGMTLEEGALAEEPTGTEAGTGEAASGSEAAEGTGTAEGTPAAVGPRIQVSGPDAAAWSNAPWTLPSDRMTD